MIKCILAVCAVSAVFSQELPHLRAASYYSDSAAELGSNPVGINHCYQNCIENRPLEELPRDKQCNCMKECNNGNAHCTGEGKTATTPEQRQPTREWVHCANLCNDRSIYDTPQKKKACKALCWEEEEADNPPSIYISDRDKCIFNCQYDDQVINEDELELCQSACPSDVNLNVMPAM